MTKRVFRSIFLASLAVLLAAAVLILGALYTYFSDVQAEQLRLQTALVAHALETEGVSYFDGLDTVPSAAIQVMRRSAVSRPSK